MQIDLNNSAYAMNRYQAHLKGVHESIDRLADGQKNLPKDDAGGIVVASRLDAQSTRVKTARDNIANSVSKVQTADGYLQKVTNALHRMGELASLAMDETKSPADKANYNTEFQELKAYLRDVATKTMNGQNLFDGSAQSVIKDSSGNFYSYNNADLTGADITNLSTGNITSVDQWQTSIDLWKVSINGYKVNQTTYKLSEPAYQVQKATTGDIHRLTRDLWYDGGTTYSSWSTTNNGGTKYEENSFIKLGTGGGSQNIQYLPGIANGSWAQMINAGDKFLTKANPLASPLGNLEAGDVTSLAAGTFTVTNPNTNTVDPPSVTTYPAGSFLGSDPGLGAGQTSVPAGSYIATNPGSEDPGATYYAAGSVVSTDPTSVDSGASEVAYAHVLTALGGKSAVGLLKTALDKITTERANNGAVSSRLRRMDEQMGVLQESLDQTVSRIRDTDVAAESTQFARHQILVKSSVDMLGKARILNESALRLLINQF